MIAAKQNQKFPFHFLSAPPTPTAENQKLRKENFWFLLLRPKGADEARRIRAYDLVSSYHALRACEVIGLSVRKKFAQMIGLEHKREQVADWIGGAFFALQKTLRSLDSQKVTTGAVF